MMSLRSAMEMNDEGSRMPRVGWRQRTRASTPDHLGGAQVDVGLVEHEELVVVEGVDEVGMEGALVDGQSSRRRR